MWLANIDNHDLCFSCAFFFSLSLSRLFFSSCSLVSCWRTDENRVECVYKTADWSAWFFLSFSRRRSEQHTNTYVNLRADERKRTVCVVLIEEKIIKLIDTFSWWKNERIWNLDDFFFLLLFLKNLRAFIHDGNCLVSKNLDFVGTYSIRMYVCYRL